MPTLDEAIAHFDAATELLRLNGHDATEYAEYARYLKQLRWYEAAIESGDLVWKRGKKNEKREGKTN